MNVNCYFTNRKIKNIKPHKLKKKFKKYKLKKKLKKNLTIIGITIIGTIFFIKINKNLFTINIENSNKINQFNKKKNYKILNKYNQLELSVITPQGLLETQFIYTKDNSTEDNAQKNLIEEELRDNLIENNAQGNLIEEELRDNLIENNAQANSTENNVQGDLIEDNAQDIPMEQPLQDIPIQQQLQDIPIEQPLQDIPIQQQLQDNNIQEDILSKDQQFLNNEDDMKRINLKRQMDFIKQNCQTKLLFIFDDIFLSCIDVKWEVCGDKTKIQFNDTTLTIYANYLTSSLNIFSESFYLNKQNKKIFQNKSILQSRNDFIKGLEEIYKKNNSMQRRFLISKNLKQTIYYIDKEYEEIDCFIEKFFFKIEQKIKQLYKEYKENKNVSFRSFEYKLCQYDIILYFHLKPIIELIKLCILYLPNKYKKSFFLEIILCNFYKFSCQFSCFYSFSSSDKIEYIEQYKDIYSVLLKDCFTEKAEDEYNKEMIKNFILKNFPDDKVIYNNILQNYYLDNTSFLWTKKDELEKYSETKIANNEDNYLHGNYLDILNVAIENYKKELIGEEITPTEFFFIFKFDRQSQNYIFLQCNNITQQIKNFGQINEQFEIFEKLKYNVVIQEGVIDKK